MGQLTVTPTYVDLSNGAAWSSLGSNTALAQAAIQQVCDDIKTGTRVIGSDIRVFVQVGLNAYPLNAADTAGSSVAVGNGQSATFLTFTLTYAEFLAYLAGVTGPNSIQTSAWGGLPGSPYNDGTNTWSFIQVSQALIGMYNSSDSHFTNNSIMGGVGLGMSGATNFNQYGLGSGSNAYELAAHEITETVLFRVCTGSSSSVVCPWNYFAFNGLNSRIITNTTPRFLSQDNGTTNIASLSTSFDAGDFASLANDAFNASGPNGPVSRAQGTPLQQRDWQALSLHVPMSTTGNIWAGLSSPPASTFSPGLRR